MGATINFGPYERIFEVGYSWLSFRSSHPSLGHLKSDEIRLKDYITVPQRKKEKHITIINNHGRLQSFVCALDSGKFISTITTKSGNQQLHVWDIFRYMCICTSCVYVCTQWTKQGPRAHSHCIILWFYGILKLCITPFIECVIYTISIWSRTFLETLRMHF